MAGYSPSVESWLDSIGESCWLSVFIQNKLSDLEVVREAVRFPDQLERHLHISRESALRMHLFPPPSRESPADSTLKLLHPSLTSERESQILCEYAIELAKLAYFLLGHYLPNGRQASRCLVFPKPIPNRTALSLLNGALVICAAAAQKVRPKPGGMNEDIIWVEALHLSLLCASGNDIEKSAKKEFIAHCSQTSRENVHKVLNTILLSPAVRALPCMRTVVTIADEVGVCFATTSELVGTRQEASE